jgi:peptidoglycan hydrolase-like protein with peptidoglycan-binding domain
MCPLNNVDGTVREWWHLQPIETNGVKSEDRSSFLSSDLSYGVLRVNIKKGNKGEIVKEVQRILNKAGYAIEVDGIFGEWTEAAIRLLQSRYAVCGKNDGIVGKRTYAVLMEIARKR